MSHEIIYTMKGVSKVYPPNRYVLKNIYLSYFYGAKIGVLGLNGSGKSSLLKIMAGVETEQYNSRNQQQFVGERIEDGAEFAFLIVAARNISVQTVEQCSEGESQQRKHPIQFVARANIVEELHDEKGHEQNSENGDLVRRGHGRRPLLPHRASASIFLMFHRTVL